MVYLNALQYHVNYIIVESNRAPRFNSNYNFHCVLAIYSNVWKPFSNIKLRTSGQKFISFRFNNQLTLFLISDRKILVKIKRIIIRFRLKLKYPLVFLSSKKSSIFLKIILPTCSNETLYKKTLQTQKIEIHAYLSPIYAHYLIP